MNLSLGERLNSTRHNLFVGREEALQLFGSALESDTEDSFHLLYVHGPGGVGKSALLSEFALMCACQDVTPILLNARDIEPSPAAFEAAWADSLQIAAPERYETILSDATQRFALLMDNCEGLAPLDEWLCSQFFSRLPDTALLVLAGRLEPAARWRANGGWGAMMRTLPLGNLDAAQSRCYLERRRVPAEQWAAIIEFTHGHPLALSLVADLLAQRPDFRFRPAAAPDVVQVLLEQLVEQVPGPRHRAALEVFSEVRFTTESLLADVLAEEPGVKAADAHELFVWLRSLSLCETGARGIFPHDLAREVLSTDLKWHDPERYSLIHDRVRSYYERRLRRAQGNEQEQLLHDQIFLHRSNEGIRSYFTWNEHDDLSVDTARVGEWPLLIQMTQHHEGQEAARWAQFWFERQPQGVLVVRRGDSITGFVLLLALCEAADELESDPATCAAWQYLQEQAPLRSGERATYCRFWMACDEYQAVSAVQSLIFVSIMRHVLSTPGLAFTFMPCSDAEYWESAMTYTDVRRLSAADFHLENKQFGVYGRDWRGVPVPAWMELMAGRETGGDVEALNTPVVVLSRDEFEAGVKGALRALFHPTSLRDNILLQSRLIAEQVASADTHEERAHALRHTLREAVETLSVTPRQTKFYRALHHTYLEPAGSQEEIAELLDVPFSTFRRHLQSGLLEVTELLWQRETGV